MLYKGRVKFWATSARQRNGGRIAAVAVMFSLWVAIYALEVSPELHYLLHEDSQKPDHNCLVTQLQHHSGAVRLHTCGGPGGPCRLERRGQME